MNKASKAFEHGKAFIPFITAGDPNLDVTLEALHAMAKAGADLVEIGIPFSDPVAEGLVIQQADERALAAGTTTDHIFEMVKEFRKTNQDLPLAFMTYINPIFVYGLERFVKQCAECDVRTIIVPDVPFEEKDIFDEAFAKENIDFVSLIAPTSKDRVSMIAKEAKGFVYCVSSMGVTGVRSQIGTTVGDTIQAVKEVSDIPCAIGFGISTPKQAQEMAKISDGVIVGSAIVKIVAKHGTECVPKIEEYVRSMKMAIA